MTSTDEQVEAFLDDVRRELMRARSKFPGDRIMTIALAEEFGELCKAVLDEPAVNVRKEAVQTAVMAARVIIDGDGSVNAWRESKGLDPLTHAGLAEFYVLVQEFPMVKEANFFRSQGGMVQEWGTHWKLVRARGIEDARDVAKQMFKSTSNREVIP